MSWIDRLNKLALKSIRPPAIEKVILDDDGVTLIGKGGDEYIRWADIREVGMITQPPLSDSSYGLVIRAINTKLTILDDTIEGYAELCEALPRKLAGICPLSETMVEIAADKNSTGKVIYRHDQ
jgi:hypothetical protein